MKKFVLIAVVLGFCALSYGGYVGIQSLNKAAALGAVKDELSSRAEALDSEAQVRIAEDLLDLAKDYLDPYEQGRMDQVFSDEYEDRRRFGKYYGRPTYGKVIGETHILIRYAIEQKLVAAGAYPVTHQSIQAELKADEDYVKWSELEKAAYQVFMSGVAAEKATNWQEVTAARKRLEESDQVLTKLLERK